MGESSGRSNAGIPAADGQDAAALRASYGDLGGNNRVVLGHTTRLCRSCQLTSCCRLFQYSLLRIHMVFLFYFSNMVALILV